MSSAVSHVAASAAPSAPSRTVPRVRRAGLRHREKHQPERERRREVDEVGREQERATVRSERGRRRHDVDEPRRRSSRSPRMRRVAPAPRPTTASTAPAPARPKVSHHAQAEVEPRARQEPVRDDALVGRVVGDGEADLARRSRRPVRGSRAHRDRPRAAACPCAPTSARTRSCPRARAARATPPHVRARRPAGAVTSTPTVIAGERTAEGELRAEAQPRRDRGHGECRVTARDRGAAAGARRRRARRRAPRCRCSLEPAFCTWTRGAASTTLAASVVSGATPNGRPAHHAASSTSAPQPRFSSGDARSRSNASIPTPCSTSLLAGWNVSGNSGPM